MLQNTLYHIESIRKIENNTLVSIININVKDEIFKGHFPGQPILPGVCLTNMITDIVSQSKNETYYLKSADSIKFINLVKPSQFPNLTINLHIGSETASTIKAEAVISFETAVFLKFKGSFEKLLY
jgi:3-hydroxyacyl-[acyl-carrier-protein] dehydratase